MTPGLYVCSATDRACQVQNTNRRRPTNLYLTRYQQKTAVSYTFAHKSDRIGTSLPLAWRAWKNSWIRSGIWKSASFPCCLGRIGVRCCSRNCWSQFSIPDRCSIDTTSCWPSSSYSLLGFPGLFRLSIPPNISVVISFSLFVLHRSCPKKLKNEWPTMHISGPPPAAYLCRVRWDWTRRNLWDSACRWTWSAFHTETYTFTVTCAAYKHSIA